MVDNLNCNGRLVWVEIRFKVVWVWFTKAPPISALVMISSELGLGDTDDKNRPTFSDSILLAYLWTSPSIMVAIWNDNGLLQK